MSKVPNEYLKHIQDEINYLVGDSRTLPVGKFLRNQTKMRAYARSLSIIGEAAKLVPSEFKNRYPDLDWKGMAGMRDRLIHHYFGVDYELVWDVVKNEIPKLKIEIEKILSDKMEA